MPKLFVGSFVRGFTIVELLIVIVVIGILATLGIVAYSGVTNSARDKTLLSDVDGVEAEIARYTTSNNGALGSAVAWYSGGSANPNIDFIPSTGNVIDIVADDTNYCIRAYNPAATKNSITNPQSKGSSPTACLTLLPSAATGYVIADGITMQAITNANCPTSRTRAVDARDNHTYWVQQLADGECWMLTNLAYAGGGTNTYGDTKTLQDGTGDASVTYTVAKYYFPPSGANVTTEPTAPSISTNGTGQYGYLYNWCAAMGVQASTSACTMSTTPAANTGISICPSGWRLPTGGSSSEYNTLNVTVNGGSTTTDAGLRTVWLGQYGGYRASTAYNGQGTYAVYATATQETSTYSVTTFFRSDRVSLQTGFDAKKYGYSVRCIAS